MNYLPTHNMNPSKLITLLATLLTCSVANLTFAQNEGGGGGESSAEASVTTSSSKKSAAAPEAIESNPVVTVVRSGMDVKTAFKVGIGGIKKIAGAGGSINNLHATATAIGSGAVNHEHIIAAVDLGIHNDASGVPLFLSAAHKIAGGHIIAGDLTALKGSLDAKVDFDHMFELGFHDVKAAVASGFTGDHIKVGGDINFDHIKSAVTAGFTGDHLDHLDITHITSAIANGKTGATLTIDNAKTMKGYLDSGISIDKQLEHGIDKIASALAGGYTHEEIHALDATKLTSVVSLIGAGLSKDDAENHHESGSTITDTAALTFLSNTLGKTTNTALKTTISQVLSSASYTAPSLQSALTSAVAVASSMLNDLTIRSASDLPSSINIGSFLTNGYNTELVKLLVKYGAIGTKGSDLAKNALTGFSETSTTSTDLSGLLKDSSVSYLPLLSTLTGNSDLGDPDGDNDNFMQSSVLKVSMDKITLSTGSKITIGSKNSQDSINVSSKLTKASSTSDRKIHVIGAAKDLTIAGDITFTNSNEVEDHALVIGAADDLYVRSEYSTANNADYSNPDTVNIKYTGSNLGLGSEDTMRLVNVNIETGGNLAIGTLNELHIGLTDAHTSTFSVGNGGKNSDPDNVYLYANNLIQVNGLNFSGRLDDVYMEAITINLNDVAFPTNADVMLRSRDGTLHFNTYNNRVVGGVNLTNVRHGGTTLTHTHFDGGPAGHIDSTISLPNGTSAIKIRKQ
jgi:hypothetical protein